MHVVAFALAVGAGLTLARAQGRLAPADQPVPSHAAAAAASSSSRLVGGLQTGAAVTAPAASPA
jgi:hypothetical protein